ncbi:MAG: glycogen debranching protein, partial [Bacteroidota bacterium]|nr:glycogen debranching protein [Bacteroidota bacterium]
MKRHLEWEKRNFDGDNDGLYDAYCCIWASDALEYSGGGVAHSSAYNYLANKSAAYLAGLIGEDPEPYRKESEKILNAMNTRLWMPSKGWYAEYQDLLGLKRLHPAAALWTVYHTLDSDVADAFKAYQTTRYVDTEIPHIPVRAKGLADEGYYMLSTTNWMPYEWSINNVVSAENMHTALAFWQSGRNDEAFKLWKSTLLDAMYLGGSPGNFLQISYYDANRFEAYRDFADQIGMASRSLVEGLFGITPDLLESTLNIRPGLPVDWDHASLKTPDISFVFKRVGNKENYTIVPTLPKPVKLNFRAMAKGETVKSVTVNGKSVSWKNVDQAIGYPQIEINTEVGPRFEIAIEWQGSKPELAKNAASFGLNEPLEASFGNAKVVELYDPQQALKQTSIKDNKLVAEVAGEKGNRTAFVKIKQGQLTWWAPVCFKVMETLDITTPLTQEKNTLQFSIFNNTASVINNAKVTVNPGASAYVTNATIPQGSSTRILVPSTHILPGSNLV